jgi:hypothetical protein
LLKGQTLGIFIVWALAVLVPLHSILVHKKDVIRKRYRWVTSLALYTVLALGVINQGIELSDRRKAKRDSWREVASGELKPGKGFGGEVKTQVAFGQRWWEVATEDGALFSDGDTPLLSVKLVENKLQVSALIRNEDLDIEAQVVGNRWVKGDERCELNFTDQVFELRDSKGRVILQVVHFKEVISIQAILRSSDGIVYEVGNIRGGKPNDFGYQMWRADYTYNFEIEAVCNYPSQLFQNDCPKLEALRNLVMAGKDSKYNPMLVYPINFSEHSLAPFALQDGISTHVTIEYAVSSDAIPDSLLRPIIEVAMFDTSLHSEVVDCAIANLGPTRPDMQDLLRRTCPDSLVYALSAWCFTGPPVTTVSAFLYDLEFDKYFDCGLVYPELSKDSGPVFFAFTHQAVDVREIRDKVRSWSSNNVGLFANPHPGQSYVALFLIDNQNRPAIWSASFKKIDGVPKIAKEEQFWSIFRRRD